MSLFPSPLIVCPWGTNISHTQERGGDKKISHRGGDKHFYIMGGTNIFTSRRVLTFYVGGDGGYDDVDKEMDVSKANILVSIVSKLSTGA